MYTIDGDGMAQILKEEIKNKIVSSAISEFYGYGFNDASLRRIAASSNITVGNLYRYFKNKDDLIEYVTSSSYKQLSALITDAARYKESLFVKGNVDIKEIEHLIILFCRQLINMAEEGYEELMILLVHAPIKEQLYDWFVQLIYDLIKNFVNRDLSENMLIVLSKMFARSMSQGVIAFFECYRDYDNVEEALFILCKSFVELFDSYVIEEKNYELYFI